MVYEYYVKGVIRSMPLQLSPFEKNTITKTQVKKNATPTLYIH
jgi:hypothetical protein